MEVTDITTGVGGVAIILLITQYAKDYLPRKEYVPALVLALAFLWTYLTANTLTDFRQFGLESVILALNTMGAYSVKFAKGKTDDGTVTIKVPKGFQDEQPSIRNVVNFVQTTDLPVAPTMPLPPPLAPPTK